VPCQTNCELKPYREEAGGERPVIIGPSTRLVASVLVPPNHCDAHVTRHTIEIREWAARVPQELGKPSTVAIVGDLE